MSDKRFALLTLLNCIMTTEEGQMFCLKVPTSLCTVFFIIHIYIYIRHYHVRDHVSFPLPAVRRLFSTTPSLKTKVGVSHFKSV